MDEIKLPPVPAPQLLQTVMPDSGWYGHVHGHTDAAMRAYARAAVEADRVKREDLALDDRDALRAEIVALRGELADCHIQKGGTA